MKKEPFRGIRTRVLGMALADPLVAEHGFTAVAELRSQCVGDRLPELPKQFVDFLNKQNVDSRVYFAAQYLPRYIRLKPSARSDVGDIEKELSTKLEPVLWMPGFCRLPAQVQISSSRAYKEGKIYGMDAASGAPVAALGVQPGDHVLDICAAPGAKLCMIAELLCSKGTLTGVDISRHRLAACRTMLQKYGLGARTRLFLANGTEFSVLPLRRESSALEAGKAVPSKDYISSYLLDNESLRFREWRRRKTRKEKQAEQRAVKYEAKTGGPKGGQTPEIFFYGNDSGIPGSKLLDVLQIAAPDSDGGYDKVLVDAECTHDGSLKHICKFEQWGWETFERRFLDPDRIASITDLQLQLLSNGFQLLKPGGTIVYSTCSFTVEQNEGVVKRFLCAHKDAELEEIEAAKSWPCKRCDIEHCLRFDPLISNTNGQFLARFTKRRH